MADQCARKVEAPFQMRRGVRCDLLGKQFAKNNLLGEIFRADHDAGSAAAAATGERKRGSSGQAESLAAGEIASGQAAVSARGSAGISEVEAGRPPCAASIAAGAGADTATGTASVTEDAGG